MKFHFLFPNTIVLQKVMEEGNDHIWSLTATHTLINQIVDLLWQTFSAHTKNATFSGHKEVNGAWLEGTTWEMDLLGKVEWVMAGHGERVGCMPTRGCYASSSSSSFCFFDKLVVVFSLLLYSAQVIQLLSKHLHFLFFRKVGYTVDSFVVFLTLPA